jgi:hypothetical protein
MFERGVRVADIVEVLGVGQVVAEYPDDTPYPSKLMLGFVGRRPLHVVVAVEPLNEICYVVTAYEPDPELWGVDFKTRRTP